MDDRRLRKFFHFTEADLVANHRGQFSEEQKKRLNQQAKAEQASARSSAGILFVVAAAGLGLGFTIGSIAPMEIGRVLVFAFMGILWPLVWAGKGISLLLSARKLQAPQLRQASGPVHTVRHEGGDFMLQAGGVDFDLDGNPAGTIMEGDEYTVYYLEATEEILSIEPLIHKQ